MYRSLDPARIVATLEQLQARMECRFPEAGLSRVCRELTATARNTSARAAAIAAHNWPLRIGVGAIIALGIWALVSALKYFHLEDVETNVGLLQSLEAAVNLLILFGGATWFLVGLDDRLKQQRALSELHTLRSLAHVVDMHQLTKDPHGSPEMSQADLARYLDYCAEMLALIAKLAALFADRIRDPVVIDAVTEIENLTTGLSRKIWQKITLIGQMETPHAGGAG